MTQSDIQARALLSGDKLPIFKHNILYRIIIQTTEGY